MQINKKFWKNKKVFITGHTGFKGSWLSAILIHLNCKVMGYSLSPQNKSLFNQINLNKKIINNYSNVKDFNLLNKKISEFNPDILFHLAAQPLVIESYKDPLNTFETNILGTLNVLESIKLNKSIKSAIIITTDKCYKNLNKQIRFKESDPLGGNDPYSWSKVCAEYITSEYRKIFSNNKKLGISTVRAGNVIGAGDYGKNRIITDVIESINNDNKIILRNPKSIRPWQNVMDALFGYIILSEKSYGNLKYNGAWNFGPNNKKLESVENITKKLIKLSNFNKGYKILKNKQSESSYLNLNSEKSMKKLNWKTKLSVNETLIQIIEWNNLKNKNDRFKYIKRKIDQYIKLHLKK